MKRFAIIAMAAVALLCGCQKETLNLQENNEGKGQVFTATMEPETKATLDGMTPSWEAGDRISINGVMYQTETDGTSTTFVAVTEGQEAEGDTYKAYFPASLYDGSTAKLPATQTYTAGKFDMPMYAESSTATLAFKNLCAVLAIKVTSEDIATLKSIKVASDKKMNGTFTVSENKAVMDTDGSNAVVLESSEALTLTTEGTTFYIAIPAQEYKYLNIFLSSDGTTYTQAMATKKAAGLGEIERRKIFSIDYARNATKLWEGNLFFADCNIGATSATEYGGYYYWGGTANQDVDRTPDYSFYEMDLKGDKDTATKLWGGNWRMPTGTELQALINPDNCTCTWTSQNIVNGLLCTGKGNYASYSVFLPAAGSYFDYENDKSGVGIGGPYWSASRDDEKDILRLFFNSSDLFVGKVGQPNYGYSVRAVLEEEETPTPAPEEATTGTAKATINDSEVDVNWVQLWENGPKFAEFNVGVTDGKAESYGGYYAWGGSQDKVDDHNTGTEKLSGDTDTATKLWGDKWRMPTSAELQDLIDNCDVVWTTVNEVYGRKYTGKGDYASNSIFLPAAGYGGGQGEYSYYWSSTPNGSGYAYDLYFESGIQTMYYDVSSSGCSVRAVLSE